MCEVLIYIVKERLVSGDLVTLCSSLGEQFPILQVLNPQEAFPSPLIKSHSSKLLTCIPHEVHIEV